MKIVLLTGIHLCHNPRVIKEAMSLARAGHRVRVLGGWIEPSLKQRDLAMMPALPFSYVPVHDMTMTSYARSMARVRNRIGRVGRRWGHEWPLQLGYAYPALRRAAFASEADLFIAHSEQGMAVAVELLHAGRKVGVDMEDWFSEDSSPEDPHGKPLKLLRALESTLLAHGCIALCPSQAMSVALSKAYRCSKPTPIYNAFEFGERCALDGTRKDRRDAIRPSVHWVSQTIGPGRGLEDILTAWRYLEIDCEVHLRGKFSEATRSWLLNQVPESRRDRLFLHPLVSNETLLARIAEHDIGFAGEATTCRSRDLTVTNKILQYLLAGLAVVASDTTGQREVAEHAGDAMLLYPGGDATALAARLAELLGSTERLKRAKAAALAAAEQHFCWERQEPALLEAVTTALARVAA